MESIAGGYILELTMEELRSRREPTEEGSTNLLPLEARVEGWVGIMETQETSSWEEPAEEQVT